MLILGLILEFAPTNMISRGAVFMLRQAGIENPFKRPPQLVEGVIETNEFEITLTPLDALPTVRPATLLGNNAETMRVVEQESTQIGALSIRAALETAGLSFGDAVFGSVVQLFMIAGQPFAYMGLMQGDCAFGALVDMQGARVADRFPCIDEADSHHSLNILGGGYLIEGDTLFLATGVGNNKTWARQAAVAQDPDSPYGKVLTYRIAADETGVTLHDRTAYSRGHRNPQGLARINGHMVLVEHGPRGGDEINVVVQGANYGWPGTSFGSMYNHRRIQPLEGAAGRVGAPAFSFLPSVAPSDIAPCPSAIADRYTGVDCAVMTTLRARQLLIVLADFARNKVFAVERIDIGQRMRRVRLINDGLYVAPEAGVVFGLTLKPLETGDR